MQVHHTPVFSFKINSAFEESTNNLLTDKAKSVLHRGGHNRQQRSKVSKRFAGISKSLLDTISLRATTAAGTVSTLMFLPSAPRTSRTALTSAAFRMNEANTMSTPCSTPNRKSFLSQEKVVTGRASLFTLDNLLAKNRNIRVRPEPKWRIGQY